MRRAGARTRKRGCWKETPPDSRADSIILTEAAEFGWEAT